jgi:hypothetical protein
MDGVLPGSQKSAIIRPIIKKVNLDPSDPKSYRPISNLTFISKLIERLVAGSLLNHLSANNLLPKYQSAYRKHYSTETSITSLFSNIFNIIDSGSVALLGLLDLSAAFDCVDYDILLDRLSCAYGIRDGVLAWLFSFLHDRSQTVNFDGLSSRSHQLECGVPQGSVLGPLLFILFTADVELIAQRAGLVIHSYADDIQLLGRTSTENVVALSDTFARCIGEINDWMTSNRLKLNPDKTQFIWLGTRQRLAKITLTSICLGNTMVEFQDTVTVLGVIVDSELSMQSHIRNIARSCFYQLRQLWSIRRCITTSVAKSLIHAFVISRIDYCNSVLCGVSLSNLALLQSVMNGAARFISRRRKFDHISDVLRDDLHWLPVVNRVDYKLCLMVYKCLHNLAPDYLSSLCVPLLTTVSRSNLRSAVKGDLLVPFARTKYGSRSFAVAAPNLWNSLPAQVRAHSLTFQQFSSGLKTYFFGVSY